MSPKPPSLLLLTPGFPASADDGACLPMHALFVRTLAAQHPGVQVVVLPMQYPFSQDPYTLHGATILPAGGRNRSGLRAWLLRRRVEKKLLGLERKQGFIGVLSFWYGDCAAVGERFAQRCGIPHYCWILGQDARAGNPWPSRLRLPAERLLALSESLQEQFRKSHGICAEHVLPPGIDPKDFSDPAGNRDIDLMAAGSLIPLKRFGQFITLVKALSNTRPQLRALLAGDGPQRAVLEEAVRAAGLGAHITFTGSLPLRDVLALMQRTRVFVHPSAYEGFSGVCMEALAAGAQVVSYCRAMREEIPQWHIAADEEALLRMTEELLDGATRQVAVQPYLVGDTVAKMMALFTGEGLPAAAGQISAVER